MSIETARIVTALRTHPGRVRPTNEDLGAEFERPSGHRLLVVADGMGGHAAGEVASRICVEAIGEVFQSSSETPPGLLREALEVANTRIYDASLRDSELRGMGTTAVLLLFTPDGEAWVAHVGDSRAYLLRGGDIVRLTADHSVAGALLRQGALDEREAAAHPGRHELLRSIGTRAHPKPDVDRIETLPGDRFLLCSDGLSDQLPDVETAEIVRRSSVAEAVSCLVEAANARGGIDNVTVLLAAVPGGATTTVEDAPRPGGRGAPGDPAPALAGRPSGIESGARGRRVRRLAAGVAAAIVSLALLWLSLR